VATLLINDLADVSEDVVLVLDDYHLIHKSDVHTLLDLLIEHRLLPLHRCWPADPIHRCRLPRGWQKDT